MPPHPSSTGTGQAAWCQHFVRYGAPASANWCGTRHAAEGFRAQSVEKHPAALCTRV